jgi:hypothetical protein
MRLLSLAIPWSQRRTVLLERQMMSALGFLNFSQSRERPDTQSPLLSAVAGSPRRMTSFAEARAYGEGHGKRSA